jgi:hypothetical protein
VFSCYDVTGVLKPLYIIANFDNRQHYFNLNYLRSQGWHDDQLTDLYKNQIITSTNQVLLPVPAKGFYWLSTQSF